MLPKKTQKCGNTGSPCLDRPVLRHKLTMVGTLQIHTGIFHSTTGPCSDKRGGGGYIALNPEVMADKRLEDGQPDLNRTLGHLGTGPPEPVPCVAPRRGADIHCQSPDTPLAGEWSTRIQLLRSEHFGQGIMWGTFDAFAAPCPCTWHFPPCKEQASFIKGGVCGL